MPHQILSRDAKHVLPNRKRHIWDTGGGLGGDDVPLIRKLCAWDGPVESRDCGIIKQDKAGSGILFRGNQM